MSGQGINELKTLMAVEMAAVGASGRSISAEAVIATMRKQHSNKIKMVSVGLEDMAMKRIFQRIRDAPLPSNEGQGEFWGEYRGAANRMVTLTVIVEGRPEKQTKLSAQFPVRLLSEWLTNENRNSRSRTERHPDIEKMVNDLLPYVVDDTTSGEDAYQLKCADKKVKEK